MRRPHPYLRLTFERHRRILTQAEIALRTGLKQETISVLESGRRKPSPKELAALAEAYGVRPELLLKGVRVLEEVLDRLPPCIHPTPTTFSRRCIRSAEWVKFKKSSTRSCS